MGFNRDEQLSDFVDLLPRGRERRRARHGWVLCDLLRKKGGPDKVAVHLQKNRSPAVSTNK